MYTGTAIYTHQLHVILRIAWNSGAPRSGNPSTTIHSSGVEKKNPISSVTSQVGYTRIEF